MKDDAITRGYLAWVDFTFRWEC